MLVKKRKAFTLIELLVVIAIIALLIAIITPALSAAKEVARDVICRSNQKGIGLGMSVYLNDFEGKACNNEKNNKHLWRDDQGRFITKDSSTGVGNKWEKYSYWGLGYRDYIDNTKVFSCPSFIFLDVRDLLYSGNDYYEKTADDLRYAPGYALNKFFYNKPETDNNNRRVRSIKNPSRFIVMHDHIEGRIEGGANAGNDVLSLPNPSNPPSHPGNSNLRMYRDGEGRVQFYKYLFRHRKKNRSWDEPGKHAARVPAMDNNPNGSMNVLFLDGSVDRIKETAGKGITTSMYSGL